MSKSVFRLTTLHQRLDEAIRRELKRRIPDTIKLLRLKKLRLAIKDRLHRHLRREARG